MLMYFFRCAFASLLTVVALPALSASLTLDITDPSGKPVTGVVAALIPEAKPNYTEKAKGIIDQRNNQFTPGVLAVRVNTLVYFPNSDNVRHHVYSFSPAKRFELKLYHGQTAEPVLFDKPGQVVLGCNIHDSMLAYIYVVDTEYFGVNDSAGRVVINGVPAGTYKLQIQQPQLVGEYPEQKITFTAEQSIAQKIQLRNFAEEKKGDPGSLNNLFK